MAVPPGSCRSLRNRLYPPVQALLRGYGSGSSVFTDSSGEQWLAHTVALPSGWGVVSLQKESEVVGGASAFLGVARWAVTAGGLLVISGLTRLIEFWIANGTQGVQ